MSKTREQIEAEKAGKARPDLLPARAIHGGGCVMGYGYRKHGVCTWRVAGTEQADPQTHLASLERHINEFKLDPTAREEGSGMPVLWHALAQLAILIDLVENPARVPGENDGEWGITARLKAQFGPPPVVHSIEPKSNQDAYLNAADLANATNGRGGPGVDPKIAADSNSRPCALPFNEIGLSEESNRAIDLDVGSSGGRG